MAKKTIWDLSLNIAGKGTEAEKAIRTVKKQLEDLKDAANQVGKDWKAFTGNATKLAMGVAGGVAAATAGVVAMANSFAEVGDNVAKTSGAIGIGIEAYQGLQHAMGQSGVSAEEFDSALKKFNQTVRNGAAGDAAMQKQLEAVGLSAKKLAMVKPEQALEEIANHMQTLPNDAARTRVALTLFGKAAGPRMMGAMKQGSAGLQELMDEAKALGIVMTDEQAHQSEAYIDAITRLKQATKGFKNQFIGSAIGPLTEAFDHLKKAIVEQMPAIQEIGKAFGQWLGNTVKRLPEIIAEIKEFGSWVKNTVTGVKDFVGGWKNLAKILAGLAIAPTLISGLKTVFSFGNLIKTAIGALPKILAKFGLAAGPTAGALLPIIGIIAGIAAAIAGVVLIVKNWEKITAWMKEHEETLTLVGIAVGALTAAIIAYNIQQAIANAGGIVAVAQMGAQAVATGALSVATGVWTAASTVASVATTAFGAAMAFLTSPITLVVLAIGAVIAIVYLLIKHWDKVKEVAGKAMDGIVGAVTAAGDFIKNIFGKVGEFFSGVWDGIKNGAGKAWGGIKEAAGKALDGMKNVGGKAIESIKQGWSSLKDNAVNVWNNVKEKSGGFMNWLEGKNPGLVGQLKGAWQSFSGFFGGLWESMKQGPGATVDFIKNSFSSLFTTLKDKFFGIVNTVKGVFQTINDFVNNIIGGLPEPFQKVFAGIKIVIDGFIGFWKNVFSSGINAIKNIVDLLPNLFTDPIGTIKAIIGEIGGFFKNIFQGAIDAVKGIIDGFAEKFGGVFVSIKEKIEGFVNFFKDKMAVVKDFFGGIGEKIGNVFGGKGKSADIPGHATGGIFKQPHIAQISEQGAEAVVPLNNSPGGFDVWKQAGELGGYLKTASEQSPAISAAASVSATTPPIKTPEPSPVMAAASQKISSGNISVGVDFKMTNNFNGGTPGGETVKQISEAGQKAGEDFESKVKSVFESIMRDRMRVSYG